MSDGSNPRAATPEIDVTEAREREIRITATVVDLQERISREMTTGLAMKAEIAVLQERLHVAHQKIAHLGEELAAASPAAAPPAVPAAA